MEQNPTFKAPPYGNFSTGEIPIVQKLYEFYRELHTAILIFPKVDKHTLGLTLQSKTLQLIELIFLASRKVGSAKKGELEAANSVLDLLKLLVRLSCETKDINERKYIILQSHLQEVGKMLGGWLRSLN